MCVRAYLPVDQPVDPFRIRVRFLTFDLSGDAKPRAHAAKWRARSNEGARLLSATSEIGRTLKRIDPNEKRRVVESRDGRFVLSCSPPSKYIALSSTYLVAEGRAHARDSFARGREIENRGERERERENFLARGSPIYTRYNVVTRARRAHRENERSGR